MKTIIRLCNELSINGSLLLLLFFTFMLPLFSLSILHAQGAVKVELGLEESSIEMLIDAPNLNKKAPVAHSGIPVAAVEASMPDSLPSSLDSLRQNWPHIFTQADSRLTQQSPFTSLDSVLFPQTSGSIELAGTGRKTITAMADGPVTIQPYLTTYNPATMVVRLIDEDGSEVFFRGNSLFYWARSDADANEPAFFQGQRDSSSMYLHKPGDYNPSTDISYQFHLKRGQRLILETTGNALAQSSLKVSGRTLIENR